MIYQWQLCMQNHHHRSHDINIVALLQPTPKLTSERMLRRVLASARSARRAGGHACQYPVHVVCAAPFLVREDVAAELLLLALDELDVREHAVGFVARGEFSWCAQVSLDVMRAGEGRVRTGRGGVAVQAGQ